MEQAEFTTHTFIRPEKTEWPRRRSLKDVQFNPGSGAHFHYEVELSFRGADWVLLPNGISEETFEEFPQKGCRRNLKYSEVQWEDNPPTPIPPNPCGVCVRKAGFIMPTSKTSIRGFVCFFPYITHIFKSFNFLSSSAEFKMWFWVISFLDIHLSDKMRYTCCFSTAWFLEASLLCKLSKRKEELK